MEFNGAHETEYEVINHMLFLGLSVKMLEDVRIQQDVYRPNAWIGQCNNFNSFVSIQQKQNLLNCLVVGARSLPHRNAG